MRALFGGAFSCIIPERFDDVSNFREVPDNQEVFSDPSRDQSVIIEILEMTKSDAEAIPYHFEDICQAANCNGIVQTVTTLTTDDILISEDNNIFASALFGQMEVGKFREKSKNLVSIYLCMVRLKQVESDILITLNNPCVVNEQSSAVKHLEKVDSYEEAMELFKLIIHDFKVLDLSIFGV
eukprot:TRINITY_DN11160_c0_g1_i1.p1 TRINITY_DN11160_c0_g1~~TRINITY_DN11160_c0_g1_i1.p1  ORF type:complete len:182 (-),score=33.31 TRINITY_DN11160_c0_g1_i1:96-641(-)